MPRLILTYSVIFVLLFVPILCAQDTELSIKELREKKVVLLGEIVTLTTRAFQNGEASYDTLLKVQSNYFDAALDIAETHERRLTVLRDAVTLAEKQVEVVVQMAKTEQATRQDVLHAQVALLNRQIALAQETMSSK